MFPAFLTVFLWSFSAVASTRASRVLGGERSNRWRLVISVFLLGALLLVAGTLPRDEALWWLLASGAIGLGLGDLAMFAAYERLGSRLTVLMTQCLAIPIAGLLEWWWLGNGLHLHEWALCLVIIAGVATALAPGVHVESDGARLRFGLLCGVGSALGLAVAGVLARRAYACADLDGQDLHDLAGGIGSAWLRCCGGVVLTFLIASFLIRKTPLPADPRSGLRWLVAAAILGPSLGVVCFQWALALERAAIVQATLALVPIMVMPLAWWLEGDRPKALAWVGGAIAVSGAILMGLTRGGH